MEPRQNSFEPGGQSGQFGEQSNAANSIEMNRDGFNPDIGVNTSAERAEQARASNVETINSGPLQSLPVAAPTLPLPVVDNSTPTPVSNSTPMVANDDDLIEKEWVDKAKDIIASTKDDPYKREQEIKRLQIDYVKKRYGKTLGVTDD